MKHILISCLLCTAMASPLGAEPAAKPATGQSQMSTGFNPPEPLKSGPKPWTPDDAYRLRHRNKNKLPRCEQDRLLTDTSPCDAGVHSH
jgi:hypothetical protein